MGSLQFQTIFAYIITLIVSMVAIFLWRRAHGFHQLLQEAANRFEEGRKLNQKLQSDVQKQEEKIQEARELHKALRKSVDDLKGKNQQYLKELKKHEQTSQHSNDNSDRKISHLEEQVTNMTAQLRESDQERGQAVRQLKDLQSEFDTAVTRATSEKDKDLQRAVNEAKELKKQLKQAQEGQKQAAAASVAELESQIKKLKRRLHQRDHLISSMRGLKEMAEERNHNWEVALRLLSTKVLEKTPSQKDTKNLPIGELVSLALTSFNQELMPESEEELLKNASAAMAATQKDMGSPQQPS